jgi:hypothetical protein
MFAFVQVFSGRRSINKYSLVVFVKKERNMAKKGWMKVQQPIEGVLLPKYRTIYHW